MRPIPALFAALLPALAVAQPAVDVRFADLEKFTDLRITEFGNDHDRAYLADELRRHVEARAPARLPAGARLAVVVTDIDMAGDIRPFARMGQPVRIVKNVYPPRIDLEFRLLRADGGVEREGRRELTDLGFLWKPYHRSREPLAYEKALLEDWLKREFPRAR